MERVISVSLGELILKGGNRKYFEDKLISQMRKAVKEFGLDKIYKEQGKVYIEGNEENYDKMVNRLKNVFGIVYISKCIRIEKDEDKIHEAALFIMKEKMAKDGFKTFKVETNRSDKNYPIKSPEMSRKVGGTILKNISDIGVDVHNPDVCLYVDIKDNGYVYTDRVKAHGGMPVGTNGRGLLLLSGGIDSPVAGYLMAKRGVEISAIHYHSYPFTSERAEEKVKELARILSMYTGKMTIYSVNLLKIQKEINKNCPAQEMTILSRRFMMKIADTIAAKHDINALITGENLGQVASQTIQGITVTNEAVTRPVFRPLIGFDKTNIIDIAKNIDTYETSILPFDDCCTVFLPKHPVTKPLVKDIEKSEELIDVNGLIEEAIEKMEVYTID